MKPKPTMEKTATLSECGTYRYTLGRVWDSSLPVLGWIMLNPSTADAQEDDPTIRKCIGFAKAWGFGAIEVRNLFAMRATDPKLLRVRCFITGRENDHFISTLVDTVPTVIAAWGALGTWKAGMVRAQFVTEKLCRQLDCIGKTKECHPFHPLYQPYTPAPLPFLQASEIIVPLDHLTI
jgi:hypothetical protein